MTRGQRGRLIGRGMIELTILAIGLVAILYVTAPSTMGGPVAPFGSGPWGALVFVTCVAGLIVGLLWMIHIHSAEAEPDQHTWRYRARDR